MRKKRGWPFGSTPYNAFKKKKRGGGLLTPPLLALNFS
jgi:hypothetical protein